MSEKLSTRTASRQQVLKDDWLKSIENLESSVEQRIQEQTTIITSMHQERLDEIRRLIAKKIDVERKIAITTTGLHHAYIHTKKILEVILGGRLADCEEGLKSMNEVGGKNSNGE